MRQTLGILNDLSGSSFYNIRKGISQSLFETTLPTSVRLLGRLLCFLIFPTLRSCIRLNLALSFYLGNLVIERRLLQSHLLHLQSFVVDHLAIF